MINANTVFPLDGDDGSKSFTAEESARIAARTDELMADRFRDFDEFRDLLSNSGSVNIDLCLHHAVLAIDDACNGDKIATTSVLANISMIQKQLKHEANQWRETCEEQAMEEIGRGE